MKQQSIRRKKTVQLNFERYEPRLMMAADLVELSPLNWAIIEERAPVQVSVPLKGSVQVGSAQSFSQILVQQSGRKLSRQGITTTHSSVFLTAAAAHRGKPISTQPSFSWQITSQPAANAAALTANGTGLSIQFQRAGTYQFRVSSGGVSTNFSVRVNSVLSGIGVTPNQAVLAAGATQRYAAQPIDQFGNGVTVRRFAVRWSATGGMIDAQGLFIAGNQSGTYSVTATATAGMSGAMTVQVSVRGQQLTQGTIKQTVDGFYTDQLLDRQEMMQVLRSAGHDNIVSATELADLRFLVGLQSGYRMPDHVRSLATDVLNSNPANLRYQGTALGNLQAGSSGAHLNKLVDKWFLGTDLPAVTAGSGLTYQWASGYLFSPTPSHLDAKQGQVGDCYFLASLSAIAQRNPAAISNMFIKNGDNTFTVRFYTGEYGYRFVGNGDYTSGFRSGAGEATYVTVNRLLPATSSGRYAYSNLGSRLSDASISIWLALAEKAYAQWNETGRADRNGSNSYAGIEAGWMTDVNAQVLGTNSTTYWVDSSSQADLIAALNSRESVTIGTTARANQSAGWVPNHAYVVTRYNAATDTFDLHNPWGTRHMPNVNWQQLLNNCDGIVVSSQVGAQNYAAPRVRGEQALRNFDILVSNTAGNDYENQGGRTQREQDNRPSIKHMLYQDSANDSINPYKSLPASQSSIRHWEFEVGDKAQAELAQELVQELSPSNLLSKRFSGQLLNQAFASWEVHF